uniref:Secreted protein n=1 Tax=Romanomermis culicivorax TaxID=13658 RepID=A0A915JLK5_ROMCU
MVGPRVALLAATISVAINSTGWKNRADAAGEPEDQSRYGIVGIFFEYWQFLEAVEMVNIVDMPSSCQSSRWQCCMLATDMTSCQVHGPHTRKARNVQSVRHRQRRVLQPKGQQPIVK